MNKDTLVYDKVEETNCSKCDAVVTSKKDWGMTYHHCYKCNTSSTVINPDMFSNQPIEVNSFTVFDKFRIIESSLGNTVSKFISFESIDGKDLTAKFIDGIRHIAKKKDINLIMSIDKCVQDNCQNLEDNDFHDFIDNQISETSDAYMYFVTPEFQQYSLFICSSSIPPMFSEHAFNMFIEGTGDEVWKDMNV